MNSVMNPTVSIVLGGETIEIGFPNIKQYININIAKQFHSDGRYALLAWGGTKQMDTALDFIDAISYFGVILGDKFLNAYKVKSVEEFVENSPSGGGVSDEILAAWKVYDKFYEEIKERSDRPKGKKGGEITEREVKAIAIPDRVEEKTTSAAEGDTIVHQVEESEPLESMAKVIDADKPPRKEDSKG